MYVQFTSCVYGVNSQHNFGSIEKKWSADSVSKEQEYNGFSEFGKVKSKFVVKVMTKTKSQSSQQFYSSGHKFCRC